jgi:hypothetical protein
MSSMVIVGMAMALWTISTQIKAHRRRRRLRKLCRKLESRRDRFERSFQIRIVGLFPIKGAGETRIVRQFLRERYPESYEAILSHIEAAENAYTEAWTWANSWWARTNTVHCLQALAKARVELPNAVRLLDAATSKRPMDTGIELSTVAPSPSNGLGHRSVGRWSP